MKKKKISKISFFILFKFIVPIKKKHFDICCLGYSNVQKKKIMKLI